MAEVQADRDGDAGAPIPFIDLQQQRARIATEIDAAVLRVVAQGRYIMGPEIGELEATLAEFAGVRHVVACSNGTDALTLTLRALGIGPGDAVFVPAFTFAATAEVVALAGATPVFTDIHADDFNMDTASLAAAVDAVRTDGQLTPRAVIAVDLFGQPADYTALQTVAQAHDLALIADAAQSFGARYGNKRAGAIGDLATTSFFPAKPLGCYGDGGAVFTHDDDHADVLRSLRVHGQGSDKYDNVRIGVNARMDTIQAAILLEKLKIFPDEIERRQVIADRYNDALEAIAVVPRLKPDRTSVWAQYTLLVDDRDRIRAELQAQSIPTAIYYPAPLNRQTAYRAFPSAPDGTPVSDEVSQRVLSLPMHPYLDEATQTRIVDALTRAIRG